MERFYEHVRAQGKSEATASSRTGDLWVYAEFLASYYGRSLSDGDYATLDECLFFFYPRKVLNSSPRAAREMCTSLKQFYLFLSGAGLADDGFAQAIWRRRDQAARVVELYEHIDSDSPQFERLFAHLFAPYTV
jgi:site-specific recombinase XerD